jgi:hypothetical protein
MKHAKRNGTVKDGGQQPTLLQRRAQNAAIDEFLANGRQGSVGQDQIRNLRKIGAAARGKGVV